MNIEIRGYQYLHQRYKANSSFILCRLRSQLSIRPFTNTTPAFSSASGIGFLLRTCYSATNGVRNVKLNIAYLDYQNFKALGELHAFSKNESAFPTID